MHVFFPFFCHCSLLACRHGPFHILFLTISKYPLTLIVNRNALFAPRSFAKAQNVAYCLVLLKAHGCLIWHIALHVFSLGPLLMVVMFWKIGKLLGFGWLYREEERKKNAPELQRR